ncbi:MAG: SBBP repeat-containing protein, partial [Thermoanaerobaculia bacterium]|nr:SBBP repeat-containing protein [Thermoanaerobaculia bacterium]
MKHLRNLTNVFILTIPLSFVVHAQDPALVWAKNMGGSSDDYGWDVAIDAFGNVYTTGSFESTADFDSDSLKTFNLTSAGSFDVFITKLDAAGNLVWAKRIGGTDQDYGRSIAVDASGNVYTTGSFSGTADFDPDSLKTFNL